MISQDRIDREFSELLSSDAQNLFDLAVRMGLVIVGSCVLWMATGLAVMLIWGLVYFAVETAVSLALHRVRKPVSLLRMLLFQAASGFVAIWVCGMAVYLSAANGGELYFLGACICVGFALFCLTNHSSFSIAAYVDFAVLLSASVAVALSTAMHAPNDTIALAVLMGGVCVSCYFALTFFKTVRDRIALRESYEAAAHDQKLKSLGQITSGVVHDFNNLLTVVGGNIELAMLDMSDTERRALLLEAKLASDRGANLVSQLLRYSRKSALNVVDISSAEVMSRVSGMIGRVVPARIETKIDMDGDHAAIRVDPGLLETAILNLLVNARDALDGRGGQIHVVTYFIREEGLLAISVEDTGPGMTAEIMRRATEPFFTTKPPGKGTGLGLAMVRSFAEQSGGSLVLTNRAGGGLVASILLPVQWQIAATEAAKV